MAGVEAWKQDLIRTFSDEANEIGRRLKAWEAGELSILENGNDVSAEFVAQLRASKAELEKAVRIMREER